MTQQEDHLVANVQMKSGAGYYLGTLTFEEGFPLPHSRDSDYYPTEKDMVDVFPASIPWEVALKTAKQKGWM